MLLEIAVDVRGHQYELAGQELLFAMKLWIDHLDLDQQMVLGLVSFSDQLNLPYDFYISLLLLVFKNEPSIDSVFTVITFFITYIINFKNLRSFANKLSNSCIFDLSAVFSSFASCVSDLYFCI